MACFQKKIYDKHHGNSSLYEYYDVIRIIKTRNFLDSILLNNSGKKILDVGCADGAIIKKYSKDHNLFGIDIVDNFLKKARKNGLKIKKADLEEKIPFVSNQFDLVFMGEVIEHVPDTDYLLSELNRILKRDGDLVISFPNVNSLVSYFMMLFFDYPPYLSARYRGPHVRDFTVKTMKLALRNNGFNILKIEGTTFFLPPFGRFGVFGRILGRIFPRFAENIILHAKKIRNAEYKQSRIMDLKFY